MALQAMLPNPEHPRLKRERGRQLLIEWRETVAARLQANYEEERELRRELALNDEMWRGLLGEDAPELRVSA